jgi:hypothetical protein
VPFDGESAANEFIDYLAEYDGQLGASPGDGIRHLRRMREHDMSDEALTLLRSIAADMRELVNIAKARKTSREPQVSDADLDSPHGNFVVNMKDPRDWSGDSMNGRTLSECPPEYLDLMAARFEYFAGEEPDAKKRGYKLKDAARCRGWAARLRNGWTPPAMAGHVEDREIKW